MPTTTDGQALQTGLAELAQAERDGKLTAAAAANIRRWLSEDPYAAYRPELLRHLRDGLWRALDDVFWTVIPFGTGGRRGRMYPIGCNAINERTIGESAQGLAAYVRKQKPQGPWSCGIAYDTRHRSREFAELCAGVLVAAGFTIDFLDDYRSTPELSFLVRRRQCDCGIMVTASHNPPTDNAVKVYAATGGQLVPPADQGVIDEVARVDRIEKVEFSSAVAAGRVNLEREEIDRQLLVAQLQQGFPGPRQLRVIYSPLHGVGEFSVRPLLEADGFRELEIFEPHRKPDGDFPNVPGHVSNPENPQVFDAIIERARQRGADLVLATDPDCDRMGAAAPLRPDKSGPWQTLNGNQLAALLADFVLRRRREAGQLTADHYLVTTLVTTPLLARLADAYGVRYDADNLVGFKWIGQRMDQLGPQHFVFGAEESHGYLVGDYCRDKDGAVACLLMCELAAEAVRRRTDGPPEAGRLASPVRRPRGAVGDGSHGGVGRDAPHAAADGSPPRRSPAAARRRGDHLPPRLPERIRMGPLRSEASLDRTARQPHHASARNAWQLHRRASFGHRTEGEVLSFWLPRRGGGKRSRRAPRPARSVPGGPRRRPA